ncbi:DUF2442 domain-containing protein [Methylobacterium iners]|jgi:hypothetical protein|uniref:DUF2442 domain-containing protein n=1 Tax=Methylobacterium iners TaxID=418707 RepID=A0ABQ4S0D9_9HYPH|nr:DUF2442 domain-containing protein [Methylobacterium iners]GJD96316.1 hypothetical protein OCOJLMKI_3537 [Methylobacterium iners]
MDEDAFDAATARARRVSADEPHAVSARYLEREAVLLVVLSSGTELRLPVADLEGLADASAKDLAEIEVSPAGRGLHFPRLDADLYVPALIANVLGSPAWNARRARASA